MCKVATIRNVARRKGWEIGDVDAELTQEVSRLKDGTLKSTVNSAIKIEGNISEEQRAELIKEADNCYVTRLVRGEWDFIDSESLEQNCQTCEIAA